MMPNTIRIQISVNFQTSCKVTVFCFARKNVEMWRGPKRALMKIRPSTKDFNVYFGPSVVIGPWSSYAYLEARPRQWHPENTAQRCSIFRKSYLTDRLPLENWTVETSLHPFSSTNPFLNSDPPFSMVNQLIIPADFALTYQKYIMNVEHFIII